MADKVTYFAVSDVHTSPEMPRTVLRRIEGDSGSNDELFSRNLQWESSSLLYSAERGDTMFDFTEITEAEADEIVDRVRSASADGNG